MSSTKEPSGVRAKASRLWDYILHPAVGDRSSFTRFQKWTFWLLLSLIALAMFSGHMTLWVLLTEKLHNSQLVMDGIKNGTALEVFAASADGGLQLENGTLLPAGSVQLYVIASSLLGTFYFADSGVLASGMTFEAWFGITPGIVFSWVASVLSLVFTRKGAFKARGWWLRCWLALAIYSGYIALLWGSGLL